MPSVAFSACCARVVRERRAAIEMHGSSRARQASATCHRLVIVPPLTRAVPYRPTAHVRVSCFFYEKTATLLKSRCGRRWLSVRLRACMSVLYAPHECYQEGCLLPAATRAGRCRCTGEKAAAGTQGRNAWWARWRESAVSEGSVAAAPRAMLSRRPRVFCRRMATPLCQARHHCHVCGG